MSKKRKRKESKIAGDTSVIERADGPAKAGPGQMFVIEPIASGSGHGQVKRARNIGEHPLTLAFERQKITADEFAAGNTYRVLCEKTARSGKDSTDLGVRSGGSGVPWSDEQVDAIRSLQAIDGRLSYADRQIVRKFCGDGMAMAEAVQRAVPCHPNGVLFRLREALAQLVEALRKLNVRAA